MKFGCTCSAKFYWQTPGAKKLLSEAVDDDLNYSIIAYELVTFGGGGNLHISESLFSVESKSY